jgi:general stress protein 26
MKIKELLDQQKYAVIATQKDNVPYTNLVAFASTEGLGSIFFATRRDTTKFLNMLNNPCVSVLIDNRKNQASDLKKATAVSAEALAKDVKKEKEKIKKMLKEKHPELAGFINEPDCELFELEIQKYFFVDKFNNKKVLSMK